MDNKWKIAVVVMGAVVVWHEIALTKNALFWNKKVLPKFNRMSNMLDHIIVDSMFSEIVENYDQ